MKKYISLFLCLSLALSCMVFSGVSAGSQRSDKNILLLNKLGFSLISSENADRPLTRNVFAYLMCGLGNGANFSALSDEKGLFEDVNNNDPYMPYINTVYRMGYMNGTGNGFFEPSGNVTMQHLTNVLVKVLGYPFEKLSDSEILEISSGCGFYKNLLITDGNALTLGEVAAVIVNSLDAELYASHNNMDYYETTNRTLLSVRFGMYSREGIFLSGEVYGKDNSIVYIDGKAYTSDFQDFYRDINGYKVKAYINISDDEVEFVDYEYLDNKFYHIEARDIISVSSDELTFYNENGKKAQIGFQDVVVIYNGKITKFNPDDFAFTNGNVTFIGDAYKWNAILINKFDTMVVGAAVENTVYDYYDVNFGHEFDENDAEFILNGEKINIEQLKKGDVLSVAYAKEGKYCTVYVSRDTVTGTVGEINSEYFVIGRKHVYRSDYFAENEEEPKSGTTITIALDHLGRAVAIPDVDDGAVKYGYFMGAQSGNGFKADRVKMYTADGNMVIYNLDSSINVNGNKIKSAKLNPNNALDTALKTMVSFASDGTKTEKVMNDYVRQLIRYKTNSDGEINYIDTAIEGINEDDTSLILSGILTDAGYKSSPSQFEFSYGIAKDAVCFYVPDSMGNIFNSQGDVDDDSRKAIVEDSFVSGLSVLQNDKSYSAKAYNITDGGFAEAIVIDNPDGGGRPSGAVDRNSGIFIVEQVSQALNIDGTETYLAEGYINGKKVNYSVVYPEYFLKDINDPASVPTTGDILQISLNYDGEIIDFVCCYDITEKVPVTSTQLCDMRVGYVYSKDDNGFIMAPVLGATENKSIISTYSKQNVYVCDLEKKEVTLGEFSDMIAYKDARDYASKVFVRARYSMPHDFVIYK